MTCDFCNGDGLVFNGGVWACCCDAGKAANQVPSYSCFDKKKEKPYYLPVWGKLNDTTPPPSTKPPEKDIPLGLFPYKDD